MNAPIAPRDAKDVAIEFAEYMAATATGFLQFMDRCKVQAESDPAGAAAIRYQRDALKSAIYEFENGAPIAPTKNAAIDLARNLAQQATLYDLFFRGFEIETDDPDGLRDHFNGMRSAVFQFTKRSARVRPDA